MLSGLLRKDEDHRPTVPGNGRRRKLTKEAPEASLNPTAAQSLEKFFAGFTAVSRPLLLLDYDGTLAPFHIDRFQAEPWPGIRTLLNRIQDQKQTRMVVITGRPAQEIVPLLALNAPFEVWGLHGFERLLPDGRREHQRLPDPVLEKLNELKAELERDSFGGLFESKPNAVVMHWRGAEPAQAARIEQQTRALFEPAAHIEGFQLQPFESGIELRAGRDKGTAATALLDECAECRPAAFLGDDLTDEAAFRAIKGRGLAALVRPEWRETAADIWLRPPEEVKAFLENWLRALDAPSS